MRAKLTPNFGAGLLMCCRDECNLTFVLLCHVVVSSLSEWEKGKEERSQNGQRSGLPKIGLAKDLILYLFTKTAESWNPNVVLSERSGDGDRRYNLAMQTFATTREAKEFLIARIAEQAKRDDVALSETERKMLYFSETAWTLPDIMRVNEAFDREYDQSEYEKKIGALAENFRDWASNGTQDYLESWNEAVLTLSREDHYLLVLIDSGEGKNSSSASSTVVDRVKLVGLAFLIVVVLLAVEFLAHRR